MGKYLDYVTANIEKHEGFHGFLSWHKSGQRSMLIPNCINSEDAFRELKKFSSCTHIETDKLLALTQYLLILVPYLNQPKVVATMSVDFNDVYDFSFIVDDYIKVLKNKRPTSKPKHDPKKKKFVPLYKDTKVTYTFGLEFNPKTGLNRLRYKLYPKKNWWGFRYEEKHRSFKDTLKFLADDLLCYYTEEDLEFSAPDEFSTDYSDSENNLEDQEFLNAEDIECSI